MSDLILTKDSNHTDTAVLSMPKKFYAVAKGRTTGIFESWAECKNQTNGFGGAIFKSFRNRCDAAAFVEQESTGYIVKQKSDQDHTDSNRKRKLEAGSCGEPNPCKKSTPGEEHTQYPTINPYLKKGTCTIAVTFDGGSRGNPGLAGSGAEAVLHHGDARRSIRLRYFVGNHATNNEAEYLGLVWALRAALTLRETVKTSNLKLVVQGDSEMIIKQLKEIYKCRSPHLLRYYHQASDLVKKLQNSAFHCQVKYEHVYRRYNKMADKLANQAMDSKRSWYTVCNDNHMKQHELRISSESNKLLGSFDIKPLELSTIKANENCTIRPVTGVNPVGPVKTEPTP